MIASCTGPSKASRPVTKQHGAIAEPLDGGCVVRDEQDRPAALLNAAITPKHFRWKLSSPTAKTSSSSSTSASRNAAIANPSRIVIPDEYVLTGRSIACSSSANATISSNRSRISRSREPLERAVQLDVLAPGEVGMEARAELEQRPDASAGRDRPVGRPDDPGDQPEQRRLAGAVAPDEADGLARRDRDGDVAERPDLLRTRPAARDEELLERVRLARADDEPPRDAVDRDLAGAHLPSYAATAASSRRTIPASTSTKSGSAFGISIRARRMPSSRARSAASTSRSQRISRWSETNPTGQTSDVVDARRPEVGEVVEDVGAEPRLAGRRLALEGERPVVDRGRASATSRRRLEQSVPVRVPGVEDPRRKRVRGEDDVGVRFPARVADTAGEQLDEAGSVPHSRTKRVSARPPAAASNCSSYFAIDSDDQCGARTSPTRSVVALRDRGVDRGRDPRLPVAHPREHGDAELVLEARRGSPR